MEPPPLRDFAGKVLLIPSIPAPKIAASWKNFLLVPLMFASCRTDISSVCAEFEKCCFVVEILEPTDATKRDGMEMG
jgi:hypothetical protein